jgi:integrase
MKHVIIETHKHPKFPRLTIDLRSKSRFYQARAYVDGLRQKSMRTDNLTTAMKLAGEWYKSLLRSVPDHPVHSTHATISERYAAYTASLDTEKRQKQAAMRWSPIKEFWGRKFLDEVVPATFHEFYQWRRKHSPGISNHTLQKDNSLISAVIRFSVDQGLLKSMPYVPKFGKIANRPRHWLRYAEWKHLQEVSLKRIAAMKNKRLKRQRQDCHDFMVFMVHSAMRVEEAENLTFDDCQLERNAEGEEILNCHVRISKKEEREGVMCAPPAAEVYKRRQSACATSQSKIFPHQCEGAFEKLLKAAGLYYVREGGGSIAKRNLKSLRSTAISFQVLSGVNLVLIANNSGTGISSIDKFYVKRLRGEDDKDALTAIKMERREYRDFQKACEFAKSLKFATVAAWKQYCQSGQKPGDIPADPPTAYRDYGWKSWDHWLGKRGPDIEPELESNVVVRWGTETDQRALSGDTLALFQQNVGDAKK